MLIFSFNEVEDTFLIPERQLINQFSTVRCTVEELLLPNNFI